MKQAILSGLLISMSLGSVALAQADKHPCAAIVKACKSAGFVKGDHKKDGKGLYIDCVNKIVKGESVAGVTISNPDDIAACKVKKEERKEKK